MKLTAKQRRFCEEYIVDCNATQAAIRAGYKEKYAHTNANKLLQNTTLKQYIDELLEKIRNNNIADATEVMEYLTSVVRGKSSSEIVVVEGVGDGCSVARTMQKKPDEKEKLKAAELLGKRYCLFKESVNLEIEPVMLINDLKE